MLESWSFKATLTTYQRWLPENFIKICLILTLKISFEKFGKNIDFRKSPKKFGQNGWREISFFYIFWTLGSQGKEGRWDIPRNMKKSENHCTLMPMLHVHVHAACPCLYPFCMSMSKLHIHVHAACPCCVSTCMSIWTDIYMNSIYRCIHIFICRRICIVITYKSCIHLLYIYVYLHKGIRICICMWTRICLFTHMYMNIYRNASGQIGTGMEKTNDSRTVRYRTKVMQSGIFLVRYWTNFIDAWMPMPNYGHK